MAGRASLAGGGGGALSKADLTSLKKIIKEVVEEAVQSALVSVKTQISAIDQNVKELNKDSIESKAKMAAVRTSSEKNRCEINNLQQKIRVHEQTIASLAWENSQKKLRIQDLTSSGGMDLKGTVIQLLAPLAGLPEEEFACQIQAVYRIETRYIKRNALEPEVHIKFASKEVRDAILFGANKNPVDYAGKRIRILKDVPLIIRQNRTDFKPLAKQLLEKGTVFKWLTPIGLQFKHREQLFRLSSKQLLEDFLEKYGEDFKTGRSEGAVPKTKTKDKSKQEKEKKKEETKKMELRRRNT